MSPVGSQSDDAVARAVRELQRKLGARVRESSEEMLRRLEEELRSDVPHLVEEITPPPPPNPAAELLAAISRVDSETTQTDILKALVEEARRFASRTAFFLIRVGEIRGWSGEGWNSAAESLGELRFEMPQEGAWADLARGSGAVRLDADGCRDLAHRLDAEAGSEGILVPFVLRGKLAGTLFADRVGDAATPDFASLQLLTHAAAQALETVAFRERGASPALRVSVLQDAAGVPLWRPAVAPPPAATPEEAVAEESTAVESVAEETVAEPEPEPAAAQPEEADDAAVAAAFEEPAAFEAAPEFVEAEAVPEPELAAPAEAEPEYEYFEPAPEQPRIEEAEETEESEAPEDVFATEYAVEPVGEPAAVDDGQIWEEDDDEPTVVGRQEAAAAEPPLPDFDEVGQVTVRLDAAQLEGGQLDSRRPIPVAEPHELETEAEVSGFELEPEPSPAFEPTPASEPAPVPQPPEAGAPPPESEAAPAAAQPPTRVPELEAQAPQPPALEPPPPQPPPPQPPPLEPPRPHQAPPSQSAAPPPAAPPPAAPQPPPAAAPTRPPESGSTEVRPPADLDGPGLAFANKAPSVAAEMRGFPAGEEALHEEARRLARLLVSEIKLYNEEVIEEGRMAGNIYSRLKEDIDRSRQMYDERIDPRIQEDYFYQELVQRLAGGDPKLLGM